MIRTEGTAELHEGTQDTNQSEEMEDFYMLILIKTYLEFLVPNNLLPALHISSYEY